MWLVIGIYLLLVFALPMAIGGTISYRGLPRGRACPHCKGETLQLVAPALRAGSALLPRTIVQRRWCIGCGWEGASRIPRVATVPAAGPDVSVAADGGATPPGGRVRARRAAARDDARGARQQRRSAPRPALPSTQTLDVRSLTLDGTPWRVMLQCWRNPECYCGRFVFVAPSGRLWLDSIEAFTGATEHEVLGQALSLPDGLLATRLRRLVTDY